MEQLKYIYDNSEYLNLYNMINILSVINEIRNACIISVNPDKIDTIQQKLTDLNLFSKKYRNKSIILCRMTDEKSKTLINSLNSEHENFDEITGELLGFFTSSKLSEKDRIANVGFNLIVFDPFEGYAKKIGFFYQFIKKVHGKSDNELLSEVLIKLESMKKQLLKIPYIKLVKIFIEEKYIIEDIKFKSKRKLKKSKKSKKKINFLIYNI